MEKMGIILQLSRTVQLVERSITDRKASEPQTSGGVGSAEMVILYELCWVKFVRQCSICVIVISYME